MDTMQRKGYKVLYVQKRTCQSACLPTTHCRAVSGLELYAGAPGLGSSLAQACIDDAMWRSGFPPAHWLQAKEARLATLQAEPGKKGLLIPVEAELNADRGTCCHGPDLASLSAVRVHMVQMLEAVTGGHSW